MSLPTPQEGDVVGGGVGWWLEEGENLTWRFERRQRGMQVLVAVVLVHAALQRPPLARAA